MTNDELNAVRKFSTENAALALAELRPFFEAMKANENDFDKAYRALVEQFNETKAQSLGGLIPTICYYLPPLDLAQWVFIINTAKVSLDDLNALLLAQFHLTHESEMTELQKLSMRNDLEPKQVLEEARRIIGGSK